MDCNEMEDRLRVLPETFRDRLRDVIRRADWESVKAEMFGPRGTLPLLSREMAHVSKDRRPAIGQVINAARTEMEGALDEALRRIEGAEIAGRLGPSPDPTLSSPVGAAGYRHPLSLVRGRVVEVFRRMGFSVAEATEVETEWACFDALNIPPTHAARDSMDTFFLPDTAAVEGMERRGNERFLLRTHMTTVQIRELSKGKLPLRIIAPGRVFRRDTVDATHSANFHQCDVVHVDRKVSLADLKGTIEFFFRELFGPGVEMRYRPSFFPFTEPSFEVDMRSPKLGKLSNVWIEQFGCGLIHSNVFRAVGIDPGEWSGQAWGIGLERIAMQLYGIDDVRHFYRNDVRFLRQFA